MNINENLNLLGSYDEKLNTKNENIDSTDYLIPKVSADTSILQDPFTENFDGLREFFENKYKSSLIFNVSTYLRFGNVTGNIIDDRIFSEDNLLFYKSLMKSEISPTETFDIYLKLKETPLWFENDTTYGFVNSINNITGFVNNSNRYLIDNLLPIFLLIENIGDKIDDNSMNINGELPIDSIDEMFNLINSTEFWDETVDEEGFYNSNSSNTKYVESNFYSILANLLIHKTYRTLNLNSTIRDRAYELANLTMIALNESMWNDDDDAFRHDADKNWGYSPSPQEYYHLSVNALGITTLLEFWIETGMESNSSYYQQAIDLYNSISKNTTLWNETNNFYMNVSEPGWIKISDKDIDLKANSMMMSACLKFFEVTGNITYHNKAMELYESIENYLFDLANNAYNSSLTSGNKTFNSNLKLSEAYLDASDIYSHTIISSEYSLPDQVPEYIFNQDIMKLTTIYSFNKIQEYFNPVNNNSIPFTVNYAIAGASINYLFKYPNGSYLDPLSSVSPGQFNIDETLPIDQGYYVYIWANTPYFKMSETSKRFDITSGLINKSINGLDNIIYPGPIVDVSLVVNNTRSDNITLTASLEGDDIINFPAQEINFTTFKETQISFNLTAKYGVDPGPSNIFFKFKRGNFTYLEIKKVIEIGYSFDYSDLLYQSKIVSGDSIHVSMNLIGFTPNVTQAFNVSFTGINEGSIEDYIKEEVLVGNEIKTVSYNISSLESFKKDTIQIKMSLLINTTEYYSEILIVKIIPKYEILSVSFPKKVPQGTHGNLILIIQNNQMNSEEFSLLINGKTVSANIDELVMGENRIVKKIISTINPYEFGKKTYTIVLKDSMDEEIARFYFEIELELSTINLVLFYVLPIIIPVGIMLVFVNKDIKHKKLRR